MYDERMKWWQWVMAGVILGLVWVGWQIPDKNLHVVFCSVGQGDASLVIWGDFQMVIDGGPKGEKLLECLSNNLPFWDRRIEVMVNTHPQKDHLGGLDDLVERYEVGKVVINGVFGGGKDGEKLRELMVEREVEMVIPEKGDVMRYKSLEFEVVWPEKRVGSELAWIDPTRLDLVGEVVLGASTDVNEVSLVGILRYGKFKAMFTGDIEFDQEKKIRLEEVDVLKVAHHGSKFSSSEEFLKEVRPEMAVVSVGKNSFGHPAAETLEKLEGVEAKIFRTDLDGEVEVVSDGVKYWVRGVDKGW